MKKLLKLFAVCSIVLAAVSVAGLCAADNADAAPVQPAAATYGGLDIGSTAGVRRRRMNGIQIKYIPLPDIRTPPWIVLGMSAIRLKA